MRFHQYFRPIASFTFSALSLIKMCFDGGRSRAWWPLMCAQSRARASLAHCVDLIFRGQFWWHTSTCNKIHFWSKFWIIFDVFKHHNLTIACSLCSEAHLYHYWWNGCILVFKYYKVFTTLIISRFQGKLPPKLHFNTLYLTILTIIFVARSAALKQTRNCPFFLTTTW